MRPLIITTALTPLARRLVPHLAAAGTGEEAELAVAWPLDRDDVINTLRQNTVWLCYPSQHRCGVSAGQPLCFGHDDFPNDFKSKFLTDFGSSFSWMYFCTTETKFKAASPSSKSSVTKSWALVFLFVNLATSSTSMNLSSEHSRGQDCNTPSS